MQRMAGMWSPEYWFELSVLSNVMRGKKRHLFLDTCCNHNLQTYARRDELLNMVKDVRRTNAEMCQMELGKPPV